MLMILLLSFCPAIYADVRGDANQDNQVTKYDAYLVLQKIGQESFDESTLQLIDMDCDTKITAYDAYLVYKKSVSNSISNYDTPEKYGAVGDGVTDDTNAFEKCMQSSTKNVVLTGSYLITRNITTNKEKCIYNGTIRCESYRTLTFSNNVSFYDTIFTCDKDETGLAAHKETFQHTSNTVFVEVWGNKGTFDGCYFYNPMTAIRGRISTGQTTVPQQLDVNHCRFVGGKITIQGFFAYTNVKNSSFWNNGDLFGGEHCVYIDQLGAKEMNITNCLVETYNSESGAAFQFYGKEKYGTTVAPKMYITNCEVKANGIVSSDFVDVVVKNTNFDAQQSERPVYYIEDGSLLVDGGYINHGAYLLGTYQVKETFLAEAKNCTFRINKNLTNYRSYFPQQCTNCTFINWGGTTIYPETYIKNCTFTRDASYVIGRYYLGVPNGNKLYVEDSAFKAGDNISYQSPGYLELKNCYYVNNIGQNVSNYKEIGTIKKDIVN